MTTGYNIREGSELLSERALQELHETGAIYECPGCGRWLATKPPTSEAEWESRGWWCSRCGGTARTLDSTERRSLIDETLDRIAEARR